ncbi:MAG: PAS domain S-box protein [Desulfobacterales bacterium]|nr:PAS domain S-box protein [Desulfobacterales bacterium]MCP4159463.1 PAS domain S-box protein [Deltaproteobacteria bacterium]
MKNIKSFYQKIFAQSPVGMSIYDDCGQCIDANNAICEIIGATKKQVLSQNFNHIVSWKKSGLLENAIDAVTKNRSTNVKFTLITTFGKNLTANANFLYFTSEGNSYLLFTIDDLSKVKKVEDEREKIIVELKNALSEIQTLREILPLCSYCKKIRDDQGYWEQVDVYISKYLSKDISHSICPDCLEKNFPEEREDFS